MKLIVSLVFIALVAIGVFALLSKVIGRKQEEKSRKTGKWWSLATTALVTAALLVFLGIKMYQAETAPDTQCSIVHAASTAPTVGVTTAADYFVQGNIDYDRGDCQQAISDYTQSIALDPSNSRTYNNRAYTAMRMHDYESALGDFDKAVALNPNYIQALMNRGDIHNYYYAIDRKMAVADYERVLALGGSQGTSACGHLFLARHNGWNLGTVVDLPRVLLSACE